jgi:hypothetical protein
MEEPSIDVLGALMRARGFDLPDELLTELAPAVRDMWELGEQLEFDLAGLVREEG